MLNKFLKQFFLLFFIILSVFSKVFPGTSGSLNATDRSISFPFLLPVIHLGNDIEAQLRQSLYSLDGVFHSDSESGIRIKGLTVEIKDVRRFQMRVLKLIRIRIKELRLIFLIKLVLDFLAEIRLKFPHYKVRGHSLKAWGMFVIPSLNKVLLTHASPA